MRRGVDLDSTLAHYEEWVAPDVIGEPIPLMAERVKHWLAVGDVVDVFTARVHPSHGETDVALARGAVQEWFWKHFGASVTVTCMKHPEWADYWDDRAVQVIKNTGVRADGKVEAVCDGIGEFVCG